MKQENDKKNKIYVDINTGRKNKYNTIIKYFQKNVEIKKSFNDVDDLIEQFYVEVVTK